MDPSWKERLTNKNFIAKCALGVIIATCVAVSIAKYKVPVACSACNPGVSETNPIFKCVPKTGPGTMYCSVTRAMDAASGELTEAFKFVRDDLLEILKSVPGDIKAIIVQVYDQVKKILQDTMAQAFDIQAMLHDKMAEYMTEVIHAAKKPFVSFYQMVIVPAIDFIKTKMIAPLKDIVAKIIEIKNMIRDMIMNSIAQTGQYTSESIDAMLGEVDSTMDTMTGGMNGVVSELVDTINHANETLVSSVNATTRGTMNTVQQSIDMTQALVNATTVNTSDAVNMVFDSLETELNQVIGGINSGISGVTGTVDGVVNTVNGIQTTVSGITDQVSGFQNTMSGITNQVGGLQNTVSGITNQVGGLQNTVSGITGQVTSISGQYKDIQDKYNTLSGQFTSGIKGVQDGMANLTEVTDTISGTIDSVTSNIDKVTDATRVIMSAYNSMVGGWNDMKNVKLKKKFNIAGSNVSINFGKPLSFLPSMKTINPSLPGSGSGGDQIIPSLPSLPGLPVDEIPLPVPSQPDDGNEDNNGSKLGKLIIGGLGAASPGIRPINVPITGTIRRDLPFELYVDVSGFSFKFPGVDPVRDNDHSTMFVRVNRHEMYVSEPVFPGPNENFNYNTFDEWLVFGSIDHESGICSVGMIIDKEIIMKKGRDSVDMIIHPRDYRIRPMFAISRDTNTITFSKGSIHATTQLPCMRVCIDKVSKYPMRIETAGSWDQLEDLPQGTALFADVLHVDSIHGLLNHGQEFGESMMSGSGNPKGRDKGRSLGASRGKSSGRGRGNGDISTGDRILDRKFRPRYQRPLGAIPEISLPDVSIPSPDIPRVDVTSAEVDAPEISVPKIPGVSLKPVVKGALESLAGKLRSMYISMIAPVRDAIAAVIAMVKDLMNNARDFATTFMSAEWVGQKVPELNASKPKLYIAVKTLLGASAPDPRNWSDLVKTLASGIYGQFIALFKNVVQPALMVAFTTLVERARTIFSTVKGLIVQAMIKIGTALRQVAIYIRDLAVRVGKQAVNASTSVAMYFTQKASDYVFGFIPHASVRANLLILIALGVVVFIGFGPHVDLFARRVGGVPTLIKSGVFGSLGLAYIGYMSYKINQG